MDPVEIVHLTGRLRRQFSRHNDVLMACAELERRMNLPPVVVEKVIEVPINTGPIRRVKQPKRDRALYMRDYRRRKA